MSDLRDDETTAILHNNLRGSGREVVIFLGDAGIEITRVGGEEIGVWPYPAVAFADTWDGGDYVELRLPHDDVLVLRIHGRDWVERIIALSPALQAAQGNSRIERMLNFWGYLPGPAQAGILFGVLGGIVWGASEVVDFVFG